MEVDIREYIAPLRKWWWLIVLSTLVAGVSSYLATRQQVPVYQSAATLMIGSAIENPNPSNSELSITQQLAGTYVDIANRASVRNATMEALGMTWLPQIFVRNLVNTNFIEVIVTDTSPERAQAVAAELSRQLILRSPTSQEEAQERQKFVNEQLADYEKAIKETQAEIEAKNLELGELISARDIADLQSDIESLEQSLQTLQSNYAALLPSSQQGATNTIREIEPASLPRQPVDQSETITILLAAGIGFVLAASAAYVLEYLDDTVATPEMLTRLTGLTTLVGIAKIDDNENRLVASVSPRSPTAEAYRVLRTAVQFSALDSPNQTLLVTSSVPNEGKSITASNLAVVMAQAGHRTLLVDTDLRRPSLHRIFDLPNRRGLTSLLLEFSRASEEVEIQNLVSDTIQATRVGGLQILSSGPIPPNPSELLGSPKMRELLTMLSARFDLVVLDSSPVLAVTDAVILSSQVDNVLLVSRSGLSKKDHVKQTVKRLGEVDAKVIGFVLTSISVKAKGYYGTYQYYGDYYDEAEESSAGTDEEGPVGKLRKRFWGRQVA